MALAELGVRSYVSEPERGRRRWKGQVKAQAAVYANRRRIRGVRGRRLLRQRGERLERPFAHLFETGGLRRVFVRGHPNVRKGLLVQVCGFNLGLVMRYLTGVGTSRSLQGRAMGSMGGANFPQRRPLAPADALLGLDPARAIILHSGNQLLDVLTLVST